MNEIFEFALIGKTLFVTLQKDDFLTLHVCQDTSLCQDDFTSWHRAYFPVNNTEDFEVDNIEKSGMYVFIIKENEKRK